VFQGHNYVMDQKTTGAAFTATYRDQFNTSCQMSGYTFAGKTIFDLPVKGVIIDSAKILSGATEYERSFTNRTQTQLDEWVDDFHFWTNFANEATINNHWPMNPASCGNYGGCEFRKVCAKPRSLQMNFLKADFIKQTPWNPLESR